MNTRIPYTAPEFKESAFNCPMCGAYASQVWKPLYFMEGGLLALKTAYTAICQHCHDFQIWYEGKMIYPNFQGVEPPNEDINEETKADYIEASSIAQQSPRGATALLRLAIQKLCIQLKEKGRDLNIDIGNLVKKGLPVKVQQSLDSLRVIGNESVHPGQIDLKDDVKITFALFKLVNFIAEKMITEPKEIEEIYNKLPESKKKQIKERDGK